MGGLVALVPVRSLAGGKRRLGRTLSRARRAALNRSLLLHTLAVLTDAPAVARIVLVTSDPNAGRIARAAGAAVFRPPGLSGLNAALTSALRAVAGDGPEAALIVPVDLPLLDPAEIERVAAAGEGDAVVLTPDRRGDGSNLLLLRPPGGLRPCFGPGSFAAHCRAARRRGLAVRVLHMAGASFDLDTPLDLAELRARHQDVARLLLRSG